jgi:hypothetical protein
MVGEIDAIATIPDGMLLVSCKSILYTEAYDAGMYPAIREAAEKVAKAVSECEELLRLLTENPIGDNYDMRRWGQLKGVVVTPHVVYVLPPLLDRWVMPGLRVASGFGELQNWLKSPEPA